MDITPIVKYRNSVVENCGRVILGKEDVIERVLICFLCSGHILLEDVPGTGKTMLLRAFASSIGGSFKRIQFTPDLLPGDLTGINFYNRRTEEFEFRPGPLFSEIVLADEINRATPRTQSSLLEAMEERQITVDGTCYPMAEPFLVMATENPLESYGTFPLPEAQIDRFFMRLGLGFMDRESEKAVIARRPAAELIAELEPVVTKEETAAVKAMLPGVTVAETVKEYILDILEATRKKGLTGSGVSTRGGIALYRASQALAAFRGRDYVIPEDVRDLAPNVLAHRLGGTSVSKADSESYVIKLVSGIRCELETL